MTNKLFALEKNIFKYRAFEMILLLHHVEDLKCIVLDSIRSTENLLYKMSKGEINFPDGTKNLYKKLWNHLVKQKIITKEESNYIQAIINTRNLIGHSIHELFSDISHHDYWSISELKFDYSALDRFLTYKSKIIKGISEKYVISLDLRNIVFEKAENTFSEEMRRLRKKIDRHLKQRLQQNA